MSRLPTIDPARLDNPVIGDRVSGIVGKNISFAAKQGTQNSPQIAAITYNIPAQETTIQLQRFWEFVG